MSDSLSLQEVRRRLQALRLQAGLRLDRVPRFGRNVDTSTANQLRRLAADSLDEAQSLLRVAARARRQPLGRLNLPANVVSRARSHLRRLRNLALTVSDERQQGDIADQLRETLRPHQRFLQRDRQRQMLDFESGNGVIVFQDNSIICRVRRSSFERHTRFNLSDLLFRVNMTSRRSGQEVHIVDVIEQLVTTLIYILETVREHHNGDMSLVFFHFSGGEGSDANSLQDIHFGGLSLDRPLHEIARTLLDQLGDTFRSNKNITLGKDFKVNVTCLSKGHVESLQNKQDRKVVSLLQGMNTAGAADQVETHERFLDANKNCKHIYSPRHFENTHSCVLIAAVAGYYWACSRLYMTGDWPQFLQQHQIHKQLTKLGQNQRKHAKVVALFKKLLSEVCNKVGLQFYGPHNLDEVLEKLSSYYKVQYSLYGQAGAVRDARYPPEYNEKLMQICLYKAISNNHRFCSDMGQNGCAHIVLVTSPKGAFRRLGGLPCPFKCRRRIYKNSNAPHACEERRRTCFTCRRPIRKKDTLVYSGDEKEYCDQRQVEETAPLEPNVEAMQCDDLICEKCHLPAPTSACLKFHQHHKQLCKYRGIFMKCCSSFIYNRYGQSQEQAEAEHDCSLYRCRLCYENFSEHTDHVCKLNIPGFQKQGYKTGFFDYESCTVSSSTSCEKCASKEMKYHRKNRVVETGDDGKTYDAVYTRSTFSRLLEENPQLAPQLRCDDHLDDVHGQRSSHEAICLVFFFELEKRGVFHRVTFTHPLLNHSHDCKIDFDFCEFDYIPEGVQNREEERDLGGDRENLRNLRLPNKKLSVTRKFLYFLLNNNMRRISILAHNLSSYDGILLADTLYELGHDPHVIMTGQKILSLTIKNKQISFSDSLRYIPYGLAKFPETFNLKEMCKGYFPYTFVTRETFGYNGVVPPTEFFVGFGDSEREKVKKEQVLGKMREEGYVWNLNKELLDYCTSDVYLLTMGFSKFTRQCLALQVRVIRQHALPAMQEQALDDENNVKLAMMLFPAFPPFITLSSWCFSVWRK